MTKNKRTKKQITRDMVTRFTTTVQESLTKFDLMSIPVRNEVYSTYIDIAHVLIINIMFEHKDEILEEDKESISGSLDVIVTEMQAGGNTALGLSLVYKSTLEKLLGILEVIIDYV